MPVVLMRGFVDDPSVKPIHGRPDFQDHSFGVTVAKRHPPFVFGVRRNALLVHHVDRVELHWWRIGRGGHTLIKLLRPVMYAITPCQQHFLLEGSRSRTCLIPEPSALLCGRCRGIQATFPKVGGGPSRREGVSRAEAHVRLGCVVNGY